MSTKIAQLKFKNTENPQSVHAVILYYPFSKRHTNIDLEKKHLNHFTPQSL